jgi:hypothetical protein
MVKLSVLAYVLIFLVQNNGPALVRVGSYNELQTCEDQRKVVNSAFTFGYSFCVYVDAP